MFGFAICSQARKHAKLTYLWITTESFSSLDEGVTSLEGSNTFEMLAELAETRDNILISSDFVYIHKISLTDRLAFTDCL